MQETAMTTHRLGDGGNAVNRDGLPGALTPQRIVSPE
jgi:hypothetical protein